MATIEKRTNDDGSSSYRVKVRLRGHPAQTSTFTRITDAKRWATQTEAAIREGRFFKPPEKQKRTLSELIDRYLETHVPQKRSQDTVKQQLLWWREKLGAYFLVDITPALLVRAREQLERTPAHTGKPRSPTTLNRYMRTVSHVFTVGVREWEWLSANPVSRVAALRQPQERERHLSDDERDRLVSACRGADSDCLYPVVMVALYTGARRGSILELRWQDVDLNRKRVVLPRPKNGPRHSIPLASPAYQALLEWTLYRRPDTDLVFPSPTLPNQPIEIQKTFERAVTRAEIEDFHFHDLRHSTASYLAMSGASLVEIAEILGHRTLAMVRRYAHLAESHTTAVVERMAAKFEPTSG